MLSFTGLFSPDQMLDSPVIFLLAQSFLCIILWSLQFCKSIIPAHQIFCWLIWHFAGSFHPLMASPILYCLDQSFTVSFSIILVNYFTSLSSLLLHNPVLYLKIQVETISFCPFLTDPVYLTYMNNKNPTAHNKSL